MNVTKFHSFLVMAGYNTRFVEGFSGIAVPLTQLKGSKIMRFHLCHQVLPLASIWQKRSEFTDLASLSSQEHPILSYIMLGSIVWDTP